MTTISYEVRAWSDSGDWYVIVTFPNRESAEAYCREKSKIDFPLWFVEVRR